MRQPETKDRKFIPPGICCFINAGKIAEKPQFIELPLYKLQCPYLELRKNKPRKQSGYCHFLDKGDEELSSASMLWNMIKECGIKDHWDCQWDFYGYCLEESENDGRDLDYLKEIIVWAENVFPLIEDDEHKKYVENWISSLKIEATEEKTDKKPRNRKTK